jgi:peroxiredoxin Q/BCP
MATIYHAYRLEGPHGHLACDNHGMVNVGDAMPDTKLVSEAGPVQLRDRLGKTLVVYFYPKDETSGCTAEACSFRDQYEDFVAAGAEVIGVSRDDATSHASFKSNHRLPFTLLSDPGGTVAKSWGVRGALGLIPGRVTFVFDKTGICKHRFDSQLRFGKHVDEALAIVKRL